MIDYLKIAIKSQKYAQCLRNNPLLTDHIEVKSRETGNVTTIGKFKGLSFTIYHTGYIVIDGSLHKYFNNGQHNYNDFGINDLETVVKSLSDSFGPEILHAQVLNLEYGLNIKTPFKPTDFTNNVITYLKNGIDDRGRQKSPITKEDRKGFEKGIKFILSQYQFKIYNKGDQYQTGENILRVELKTLKTEVIKRAEIKTLRDLTVYSKLSVLHEKLMHTYSFLIIREKIDSSTLCASDRTIWEECINPDHWIYDWNKDKRQKRKSQFARIQTDHALSDIKSVVHQLLQDKFKQLTSPQTVPNLTGVRNEGYPHFDRLYTLSGWGHLPVQ